MHDNQYLLIVDDDATFTRILGRAMSRRGYQVLTACNTIEAMDLCRRYNPGRAVVDLKLESESGLHLLPQLLQINAQLEVLILTGYSSISTAVEAIKLGALNYLCKPASVEDILAAFATDASIRTTGISDSPPSVERLEWEHIQRVLAENAGNISATARSLGMHRRTLQRKLQKRPVRQ